jgi:protoporphyrinogen/coproporphyrinogen III oxidase
VGYTEKVVVIGAGISGLACAFRLKQFGIRCLVLEDSDRPGGVIATIRRNGFLFETGPQCPRFPAPVWRLVHDLKLESEFVAGDSKAKRHILQNGTLHPAPFSPKGLIATRLVGLRSKMRVLTEALRSSQPPAHEESLAEFVQRKFGTEVLDNLVDPFISTIFFGDSCKMGMQSAFSALVEWERSQGSLVRGAIRARRSKSKAAASNNSFSPTRPSKKGDSLHVTDALPALGSFASGMGRLPEKIAEELQAEIRYGSGVASIASSRRGDAAEQSHWQISLLSGEEIDAEQLILAVPAYAAGELLANAVPRLASDLKAIEYAPICAVSCGYDRLKVTHDMDGFGFMVPRREGLQTICTFWNSSLFPKRAPEGKVLMTSFASTGGSGDRSMDEEELARIVEAENAKVLGITDSPVDRVIWKDSRALPQYNVGHAQRVREIDGILQSVPNLHLAGNFLKGRSIGDCVEIAFRIAENVHSRPGGNNI